MGTNAHVAVEPFAWGGIPSVMLVSGALPLASRNLGCAGTTDPWHERLLCSNPFAAQTQPPHTWWLCEPPPCCHTCLDRRTAQWPPLSYRRPARRWLAPMSLAQGTRAFAKRATKNVWGMRSHHGHDKTGAENHMEMVGSWLSQLAAAHARRLARSRCAEVPWAMYIRELPLDSPHPSEALEQSVKLALGVP